MSYHTPSAHSAVEIGESQPLKEGIEPNSSSTQERYGKNLWANIHGKKLILTFMTIMLILMGVGFGVPLSYHLMVNGVVINIVGFFGIIANLLIMRVSSQQQMRSSINIIICGKTYVLISFDSVYRDFSPYANFITAIFITAVFQNFPDI